MIDYETYMKIKTYRDHHGLTGPQIACKLGLDPRTVEKWIDAPHFQHPIWGKANKLILWDIRLLTVVTNWFNTK